MDSVERTVFKCFQEEIESKVEPVKILKYLKNKNIVSLNQYNTVFQRVRELHNRCDIWREFFVFIKNHIQFPVFLKALFNCGYKFLAHEMTNHFRERQSKLKTEIHKVDCDPDRHQYIFMDLKAKAYDKKYSKENLQVVCERFRGNFENERNPFLKMQKADEYAYVLCAAIDSHIMEYAREAPNHHLFSCLQDLIPHASNTRIINVAYKTRMGIAYAIAGDISRADKNQNEAIIESFDIGKCIMLTNMIYFSVYIKICEFEENPTDPKRKEIIRLANIGMQTYTDEEKAVKVFWDKMFLQRMIFCLLGLSNRGDPMKRHCNVGNNHIKEASEYISILDEMWNDMDARRRQFYYVAQARICELECDMETAIYYLEKAVKEGIGSNFGETKFIQSYLESIKSRDRDESLNDEENHSHGDSENIVIYNRDGEEVEDNYISILLDNTSKVFICHDKVSKLPEAKREMNLEKEDSIVQDVFESETVEYKRQASRTERAQFERKERQIRDTDLEFMFDFVSQELPGSVSADQFSVHLFGDSQTACQLRKGTSSESELFFSIMYRWKCWAPKQNHVEKMKAVLSKIERKDVLQKLQSFSKEIYRAENVKNPDCLIEEADILVISQHMSHDYFNLARFLGISNSSVEQIKTNYSSDIQEQIFQTLLKIKQSKCPLQRQDVCNGLLYCKRNDIIDILHENWD